MAKPKKDCLEPGETVPDAWGRFERAVDAAVKSGPKHKIGKRKAKASAKGSQPEKRGRAAKLAIP